MMLLVVIACIGLVFGEEPPSYLVEQYEKETEYEPQPAVEYNAADSYEGYSKQVYYGNYPGKCEHSGFYYLNENSFMMCSNGYAYEQNCAKGSKNSGHAHYKTGSDYYIHDFCDVNMLDYAHAQPGYDVKPREDEYKHIPEDTRYEVKQPDSYSAVDNNQYGHQTVHSVPYNADKPTHPIAYNADKPAHPIAYNAEKPTERLTYNVDKPANAGYDKPIAVFRGPYHGKCESDGFYYNNDDSFVMCSNGNSYVQKCAPGSKNSGHQNYQHGSNYGYHDFCDVNLVDYGYAANFGGYGGYHGNNYFRPNPRFFQQRFH